MWAKPRAHGLLEVEAAPGEGLVRRPAGWVLAVAMSERRDGTMILPGTYLTSVEHYIQPKRNRDRGLMVTSRGSKIDTPRLPAQSGVAAYTQSRPLVGSTSSSASCSKKRAILIGHPVEVGEELLTEAMGARYAIG